MQQILITGGTGFFGKSLMAADLFPEHTQLFLLSRNGIRSKIKTKAKCIPIFGDIRTVDLQGFAFDTVIHAAAPSGGGATDEEMYSIITDGTRNLLDQLQKMGTVKRMLYISSGAVYGPQDKEFAEETDPLAPVSLYGKGKAEAEQMCLQSGIPCVIARCFAFIGEYLPRDAHFAAGNFLADLAEKRTIQIQGDGSPIRSYLHADDLAQWLYALLLRGTPGEAYNVGSEEAVSILELAQAIAIRAAPPLKIEIKGLPSGGKAQRYLPSTQKIRRELGLSQPGTLLQSLDLLAPAETNLQRDLWLSLDDEQLSGECVLDFHKASGNGGQHVNKTSSAVRLIHKKSGLDAGCAEHRSQHDNRRCALDLLRQKMALQLRCAADPEFKIGEPPPSMKNPRYALWTAQLLDHLFAAGWELKPAAERIGTGTSKFVKLLYRDHALWQHVQNSRAAANLPPLNPPGK